LLKYELLQWSHRFKVQVLGEELDTPEGVFLFSVRGPQTPERTGYPNDLHKI
jgi:hypothetical protein